MDLDGRARLAGARSGERWVIRHRLPDGSATDVIGWINTVEPTVVDLSPAGPGPAQRIRLDDVVAARRAPAAAGGRDPLRTSAADLERIALPGWLADHEPLGDWVLRSAGGFTRRANSCLAVGDPGLDHRAAAERIVGYAADHGIEPRAQVIVGSEEDNTLRALGWAPTAGQTDVLVAGLADLLADTLPDPAVGVSEELSDGWLAAYHQSRPNAADPRLLRMILEGRPPRAFGDRADPGSPPFAIGRGHVSAGWLGLASIWVHTDRRRQGWGRAIVLALGHWGARHRARSVYLQVASHNSDALAAYEGLGFRRHHTYGYLAPGPRGQPHTQMTRLVGL